MRKRQTDRNPSCCMGTHLAVMAFAGELQRFKIEQDLQSK
jgi:hypothetical protein